MSEIASSASQTSNLNLSLQINFIFNIKEDLESFWSKDRGRKRINITDTSSRPDHLRQGDPYSQAHIKLVRSQVIRFTTKHVDVVFIRTHSSFSYGTTWNGKHTVMLWLTISSEIYTNSEYTLEPIFIWLPLSNWFCISLRHTIGLKSRATF